MKTLQTKTMVMREKMGMLTKRLRLFIRIQGSSRLKLVI